MEQIAQRFALRAVAVTQGDRGALLFRDGISCHVDSQPVDLRIPLGLATAFNAVIVIGLVTGAELEEIGSIGVSGRGVRLFAKRGNTSASKFVAASVCDALAALHLLGPLRQSTMSVAKRFGLGGLSASSERRNGYDQIAGWVHGG